ncbi:DUF2852 domain-containing protein [Methylobacterium sp. W2]|uniref:DUF2852 domain-containing protein n=1 Tax=Methylobacterium sp. W2 TaxID=2598107 RepID=UPI001D0C3086|nr:DUF2852 domain-containing protein [Methylobacterium sp. W2]MCC0805678.1 DUF2852 domain-containing protein [Methylobacterium sp. W2]
MSFSSTSPWATGKACRSGPFPRRSFEIGAVVVAFIYWWPLAAAYIAWKVAGYPALSELRGMIGRGADWQAGMRKSRFAQAFEAADLRGTGNLAFDDYRRSELDRLDAQRKALQEESKAFAAFVEELKRAKDREQFDAFMAKRNTSGPTQNV